MWTWFGSLKRGEFGTQYQYLQPNLYVLSGFINLIHHYNNNFRMFKPSLKRSKLDKIQLYSHKKQPPHYHHNRLLTGLPSTHRYQSLPSSIIPSSFIASYQQQPSSCPHLFNPLNYQWRTYPQHIQDKLQAREESQSRGIGYYKEYIWYFQSNELILEHTTTKKHKILWLQHSIDFLAVGEIQNSSLHLKSRQLFIVAIGVQNVVHLYGIQKDTLNLTDFNFSHQIINSRLIQQIKFVNKNEIIIATDTCNYCHIDFSEELKIRQVKYSLLNQILPYMPLISPSANYFIQDLQIQGSVLYSLVREQRKVGWLSVKASKLLSKFTKQNKQPQYIIQSKRIEVLEINKKDNSIKLIYRFTQDELIKKLILNNPELQKYAKVDQFKIVSIWLHKKQQQEASLSVVTRGGYFITIKKTQNLTLDKNVVLIPKPTSIGLVGFNIQKKEEVNEQPGRSNLVKASLGLGNLTIMNDSIWYLDENAIEAVKCEQITGQLVELQSPVLHAKKWIILTKAGYYIVKRLEHRQIFLSYLYVKNYMVHNQPQKSWNDQTNFNLFLENLAKIMGYQKICEFLIQILLFQKLEFSIAETLLARIRDELKGCASRDYRDWNYELDVNQRLKIIQVDQQFRGQCWKFLLELQFKSAKVQTQMLQSKSINCSAYWYSLINIFKHIAGQILVLKPSDLKPNLPKIQQTIKLLQKLSDFLVQKKERENRYVQNYQFGKKQSFGYKGMANKLSMQSSRLLKKEQDHNQSTIDYSNIMANNRIINQSNSKLQSIMEYCIGKIKAMMVVFVYLADFSQNQNLPSLNDTIKFRKNQQIIKKYLISRVQDKKKLHQFDQSLPELQISKDLKFINWFDYTSKLTKFDDINLAQVATFISSEYLPKTLQLLREKWHLQTDLLLLYWDYLCSQLESMSKMQQIESKREDIFAEEKKTVFQQKRDFICSEIKFIQTQVRISITNGLKAYMTSNEQNYSTVQNMINAIVQIVAAHDDNSLNAYLQGELVQFGISQKLIMFKSLRRKQVNMIPAWQTLLSREQRKTQSKKKRELLSNFQTYFLQTQ